MKRRRLGFPLAILLSLDNMNAKIWNIYSESVKPGKSLKDEDFYNFSELIINEIRPRVKEGIKTVLISAPEKKIYEKFMNHVGKHQSWLIKGYELNTITFEYLPYPARNVNEVKELIRKSGFNEKLEEASIEDDKKIVKLLEKRVHSTEGIDTLLFNLTEIEKALYSNNEQEPEYIVMTDEFHHNHKRQTNRILQVAKNKKIKTTIINSKTNSGNRLGQFGGLICFLKK